MDTLSSDLLRALKRLRSELKFIEDTKACDLLPEAFEAMDLADETIKKAESCQEKE